MERDQERQRDRNPEVPDKGTRKTRLNRIPIGDSERGTQDAYQTGGAPTADSRPGAADDEGRNTGYSPDSGYDEPVGSSGMSTVGSGTISPADEKTWSVLAHLSLLLNLVTGIGGFVAALMIWLLYKDRSPRVGFHALQSLWYQVAWAGIFIAFGVISTVLSFVTFGVAAVFLVPLGILLAFVPFVHQIYAAIKVNGGEDYRYPIIADMIDGSRRFD